MYKGRYEKPNIKRFKLMQGLHAASSETEKLVSPTTDSERPEQRNAERHLLIILGALNDVTLYFGLEPDQIPVGTLLAVAPAVILRNTAPAGLCGQTKARLRAVQLLQAHARSLGYSPSPAAEVWLLLLRSLPKTHSTADHVTALTSLFEANLVDAFARWIRRQRGGEAQ